VNPLIISTFNSINAICEGSTSPILPGNSTNIPVVTGTWNPSVVNTTIPGTSTYTIIPTAGQCASTQTMDIIINPLPVLIITSPAEVCFPATVDITNSTVTQGSTGTDLLTYWSSLIPLTTLTTPTQITESGSYFIQSTSLSGCSSVASVNVLIHSLPIAEFTPSPSIVPSYYTQSTMVNTSINATNYIWDFGDQSANSTDFSPAHEFPYDVFGNYTVKLIAISQFGCTDTAYQTVSVKEELVYYIPNSFSPDDNNTNDDFIPIFTSGFDPNEYSLLIFNRWGEIVFESYDAKIGWNGKMGVDGNTVQIGTYTWKIEFKAKLSPQKQIVVGHVNVIR
jgi:gliding motility-associated-like protein